MNDQPTEKQIALLKFFDEAIPETIKEASAKIETLLSDPKKKAAWSSHSAASPPTAAQLRRLNFAAHKKSLSLPNYLTKHSAKNLIDKWFSDDLDLEDAYQEWKQDQEEKEARQLDRGWKSSEKKYRREES